MKKIILALALSVSSMSAFSQGFVQPRVSQWGNNVQIQIFNHTDYAVSCSGWINFSYWSGRQRSEYFNDYVQSRFNSYRTVYNHDWNDRVSRVNHSIYCY
ncbi:MAG TPA: hypothetical protein VNJ01_01100 [Bacteriovoracaceae bacterium]|nr:hypothetical protein [Bacteriovoracaceae bacterium]